MTMPKPFDLAKHGKLKIVEKSTFTHTKHQQFVALTVDEFAQAASSYPLVFLKDSRTGDFQSVALLGFEQGQNLYLSDSGWAGVFVPFSINKDPFSLGPTDGDNSKLTLYIDESSDNISQSEGITLVDSQGESGFLKGVQQKLSSYLHNQMISNKLVKLLSEKALLKEIELLVQFDSARQKRIKGLYTIDEDALKNLDEDSIQTFFKANYFVPIYAMLSSITQFNRLLQLHNVNCKEKIVKLQMRAAGEQD